MEDAKERLSVTFSSRYLCVGFFLPQMEPDTSQTFPPNQADVPHLSQLHELRVPSMLVRNGARVVVGMSDTRSGS